MNETDDAPRSAQRTSLVMGRWRAQSTLCQEFLRRAAPRAASVASLEARRRPWSSRLHTCTSLSSSAAAAVSTESVNISIARYH